MDYRIVKKDAFRIVGVRTVNPLDAKESFEYIPGFWQSVHQSGVIPKIVELINAEPKGVLGVSTCDESCTCNYEDGFCKCNVDDAENYYYIAASTDKPVPEGMFAYTIPACTWAIFLGSGTPSSIHDLQKRIFSEWLPTSGYEWAHAPDVEVYLDQDPTNMKYEVWMPVMKKA